MESLNFNNDDQPSEQTSDDKLAESYLESDYNLLKQGAKIIKNAFVVTGDQIDNARGEMERVQEEHTALGSARRKALRTGDELDKVLGVLYGEFTQIGGKDTKSEKELKQEALELLIDGGFSITTEEALNKQGETLFHSLHEQLINFYNAKDKSSANAPLIKLMIDHYLAQK